MAVLKYQGVKLMMLPILRIPKDTVFNVLSFDPVLFIVCYVMLMNEKKAKGD